jgi:hypothetical protein
VALASPVIFYSESRGSHEKLFNVLIYKGTRNGAHMRTKVIVVTYLLRVTRSVVQRASELKADILNISCRKESSGYVM